MLGSWGLYGETWDSSVICLYRLQAGSVGANSLSPLCPLTAASGWNSEAAATGLEKASLLSMKVLRGRRGGLAQAGAGGLDILLPPESLLWVLQQGQQGGQWGTEYVGRAGKRHLGRAEHTDHHYPVFPKPSAVGM